MSFFSSLSKIIQGDTRVRTRDLSDCSRTLYHWAISPLHVYSIPSPQTRAGCLSTVTMFFVPIQVYSRDRWHFSLVFKKFYQGTPFVRTRDLSDYSRMLYPELYPRCIQIQKYHCTHAQVVWALLQCFLTSKVYSRDRCHFSLVSKIIPGTPGFEPGTSRTAAECSTTELYPRCIQIQ